MKEHDPEDKTQEAFMRTYVSATTITPRETWEQTENTNWKKTKTREIEDCNTPQQNKDELGYTQMAPVRKTAK